MRLSPFIIVVPFWLVVSSFLEKFTSFLEKLENIRLGNLLDISIR